RRRRVTRPTGAGRPRRGSAVRDVAAEVRLGLELLLLRGALRPADAGDPPAHPARPDRTPATGGPAAAREAVAPSGGARARRPDQPGQRRVGGDPRASDHHGTPRRRPRARPRVDQHLVDERDRVRAVVLAARRRWALEAPG